MMVLEMIKSNPHITPMELMVKLNLADRTITNALRELKRKKLIKRVPHSLLMDMRKAPYVAT